MDIDTVKNIQHDPFLPPGLKVSTFQNFFRKIAHGGYLLFLGAIIAIAWSNLFPENYIVFWHTDLGFSFGHVQFSKTLVHWVNDALMTIFFFTVGLEIKREFLVGGLSHRQGAILPVSAALGLSHRSLFRIHASLLPGCNNQSADACSVSTGD